MMEISGYEMLEKIGAGGMATVWKARQLSLDRLVAIKVLDQSSLPDQEARDLFRKEAQTAARLNHPGIVQVFDTGEVDGRAYLVMEYVDGESVADQLHARGAFSEARALEIAAHVARALAYAWEKECLIHCDVNPSNILINRATGQVKVADLGLARMITLQGARADDDRILGTPNYTAPEQSAGLSDLDCRADIYSLGATLYHMVTGVLPFREAEGSRAMEEHENGFLDDPQELNPKLTAPAAWLIEKMMIKNRAMRPHFWTQVVKDIDDVRAGQMPAAPLPEAGASTVRRAPGRIVPAGPVKPLVVPRKEPVKLVIRKEELPPPPAMPKSGGGFAALFRFALTLFVMAAVAYGVLVYLGVVEVPKSPFAGAPAAEESDTAAAETASSSSAEPPSDEDAGWRNEDFIQGARLFNGALADYKQYQETRTNPEILVQVEENLRDAIAYFESARGGAPADVDVGQYIDQCYGLIANVRQSTLMDAGEKASAASPSEAAPPVPPPSTSAGSRQVVYIDDEPEAAPPAPVRAVTNLLRVSFAPGWDQPTGGVTAYGREWPRLLARFAEPSADTRVDAAVVLYPGIACMTTAREAARALKQELPVRRPVATPGLPRDSLFSYQFEGDFSGASRLVLVCDQNDRVVMVQLTDERPVPARLEPALFSSNWSVVDFIGARLRDAEEGLIGHQVRKQDGLVRIHSELAEPANNRQVVRRSQLLMPEQMAALILHASQGR